MAAKYHISDNGMPGKCSASSPDSCPKTQAGDGFHGTLEEATQESQSRFEAQLGAFVTASKKEETAEAPTAEGYTAARFDGYTAAELRTELAMWDTENPAEDTTDLEMALVAAEAREAAESSTDSSVEIYRHPQGKFVQVYADGSVRAFDKDGREAKTSATAEKLREGYGSWKRDHSAAKPAVSKEDADAMMDELVSSEMNYERARNELSQGFKERKAYDEAYGLKEGRAWHTAYDYSSFGGMASRKVRGMNPKNGPTQYTPTQAQIDQQIDQRKAFDRATKWREEAQTNLEEAGLGHKIPDEGNTVRVRTQAQKWLLKNELQGQISDGHWENSGGNAWEDWSNAKVIVDPDNPGRNFNTSKDNYQLNSKALLDVVGDRMVEDVQKRTGKVDYNAKAMNADLKDLREIFKTKRGFVSGN